MKTAPASAALKTCPACNSVLIRIKNNNGWKWAECLKCGAVGKACHNDGAAEEAWNDGKITP